MFFHSLYAILLALVVLTFTFSGCSRRNGEPSAVSSTELVSSALTTLDNSETHDGFLFHANYLWVGHSVPTNFVEVFATNNPTPVKVALSHGASVIKPFGRDSVLILGPFRAKEQTLHYAYTVATVSPSTASGFKLHTQELSPEIYATSFAGSPEAMFFADRGIGQVISYKPWQGKPGEKAPEYRVKNEEENTDLQTVLNTEAPGSRLLNVSARGSFDEEVNDTGKRDPQAISGPDSLVVKEGKIFSFEQHSTKPDDDGMVWLTPQEGKVHRVFNTNRWGLSDVVALDERFPWIVAAEFYRKQLLLVNAKTAVFEHTIALNTYPTAVKQLGHCLVVLGQDKTLFFLDLNEGAQTVDSWDLKRFGFFLDYPRNLALDADSATVFVGSRRSCTYCQAKSNGVVKIHEGSKSTFNYCLK